MLLAVAGDWAHPVPGGAVLATTVAEANDVARATRLDRRLLGGRGQTSSNQVDQASGGATAGPGSRPSQEARTR